MATDQAVSAPRLTATSRVTRLLRESCWLVFVGAAIYLVLILATYHFDDAAWSYAAAGPIHNGGGRIGAWVADLLLYVFGFSAWWWEIGRAHV